MSLRAFLHPLGAYPRRHTLPDEARARARALVDGRRRI
jgi:hypothetical protein